MCPNVPKQVSRAKQSALTQSSIGGGGSATEFVCLVRFKMTKRTQFCGLRQNDLVPTNRRQPPQCAAQHRSGHGRRQEEVPTKCPQPWADRRNGDRFTRRGRGLCRVRNGGRGRL